LLAILIGIYGLVHANTVHITRLNLRLNNLPGNWQGKRRMGERSPFRAGEGADFSQQVVDKINSLNPDVVFVGGDLFDGVAGDYQQMPHHFRT